MTSNEAWEVASRGLRFPQSHFDSLIRLAQAARLEGDFAVVADCAARLRAAPPDAVGQVARTPGMVLDMEASAKWEQGLRVEALDIWRMGAQNNPNDIVLADRWIRHLVRAEGIRSATVGIVQKTQQPTVAAAVVGVLLRAGELSLAGTLSNSIVNLDIPSPYLLHGLTRVNRWEDAWKIAERIGNIGSIQIATAGIWVGAEDILQRALSNLPVFWRVPLDCLLAGKPVSEDHQMGLRSWLMCWADVGCRDLFRIGTGFLSGSSGQRMAKAALILYRADQTGMAVEMASQHETEPDALEVLGLCAYEAGDFEAASRFLSARAEAGPAPVRVYYRGAQACLKMGQAEAANRLMALGRMHRPCSKLLSGKVESERKVWKFH